MQLHPDRIYIAEKRLKIMEVSVVSEGMNSFLESLTVICEANDRIAFWSASRAGTP